MKNISDQLIDMRERLDSVIHERISRENLSRWAISVITDDSYKVEDKELWRVLTFAGGIDSIDDTGRYLYDIEDINTWINILDAEIKKHR